jgi:Mg2+ and Co2+ transporter CorA
VVDRLLEESAHTYYIPTRHTHSTTSHSNISHGDTQPVQAAVGPPCTTNSNSIPQQESFAPTHFDRHASWNFEDLPYCSYLESLQHAIPGVFDLVSLIRKTRSQITQSGPRTDPFLYTTGEHIVIGEISANETNTVHWHDIDCANAHSLNRHSRLLACTGSPKDVAVRYMVMDDFSARAVELLGHELRIDPSVFIQHLHQSLRDCSVENVLYPDRSTLHTAKAPSAIREIVSHRPRDYTYSLVCPTDVHLVPTEDGLGGASILSSTFQESQLQRVPRSEGPFFDECIHHQMSIRSFMQPSICTDFGPYLPARPMPGDDSFRRIPFQRITFDRSDHVVIHLPGATEIPTGKSTIKTFASDLLKILVLIFRTPSAWNHPIEVMDLQPIHQDLSEGKTEWKVLRSPDHFQLNPVPDFIPKFDVSSPSQVNGPYANDQSQQPNPSESVLDRGKNLTPNLALCKALVEWHMRCASPSVTLNNPAIPAQIYFLERVLSRLSTVTKEDYERVYLQCSSTKLKTEEKRRLLDYCRTRGARWERQKQSNSRALDEIYQSLQLEPEEAQRFFKICSDRLKSLVHKVQVQLQESRAFVCLQLEHIAADQQRQLMHNQIELSQVQIAESRKAIQQTETMRKLTILAFVFIPSGTICSFFGMNIRELDRHPPMWIFFTTLVLVVSIVIMIATADHLLNFLMRIFAALPALPLGGESNISRSKRWAAIILFWTVHYPFALVWKAVLAFSKYWSLSVSQGREYRTGYQSPHRFHGRQSEDEATIMTPYVQKGALIGDRVGDASDWYRHRWREFWQTPAERRRKRAAFLARIAAGPPPMPDYINGTNI